MLFIILIYYLTQAVFIGASPLSLISIDNRSSESNPCSDLNHCRTMWGIVWSCLTTVYSCTWVAVHPNIPCPRKKESKDCFQRWVWNPLLFFVEHRLPLFVCAVLVPEYILAWAIRQWLKARQIDKENKGLSRTHGFFIVMGGFHLFEDNFKETNENSTNSFTSHADDIPIHPLTPRDLYGEDTSPDIDFSSFTIPTVDEIEDKGKSDWLAKSLVLVQTSWFVLQCIARAIERLPVTHLEIVTLAYAAMNFVIYAFWWNKPLNVNRPVRVFRKSHPKTEADGAQDSGGSKSIATQPLVKAQSSETRQPMWKTIEEGLWTIGNYISGSQDFKVDMSREDRVPMFWAAGTDVDINDLIADAIGLFIGAGFGAIHCIAWFFVFPTHKKLLLWRISSVAITAVPVYIPLMVALGVWLNLKEFYNSSSLVFVSVGPVGILYIMARTATLALAFISLRDLPAGAYETVYWTTFIPHI